MINGEHKEAVFRSADNCWINLEKNEPLKLPQYLQIEIEKNLTSLAILRTEHTGDTARKLSCAITSLQEGLNWLRSIEYHEDTLNPAFQN